MFDWLADPVWGGISVLAPFAAWLATRAYRALKKRNSDATNAESTNSVPPASEAYELVNRFVAIFKAHGIERIQIPRFLGDESGLTFAHMGDDEKLLHVLSDKILNDTCTRFGLMRNWLDGKSCPIYPGRWYDKNLKGFIDLLERLQAEHDCVEAFVIKSPNDNLKMDKSDLPIVFVLRGQLDHWGGAGEESIWRYYPLNDTLFWGYLRTRIEIKAMALSLSQFDIHTFGCVLPEKDIEQLIEGSTFPGPLITNLSTWQAWHPDAFIFTDEESCLVKDGKEALAVRKEMERLGWMNYLIEKTGSLQIPLAHLSE